MAKSAVAEILTKLMEEAGLNPTSLSRESGVLQSTIWKIANGKIADPGTDVLKPIAERFGKSVAQLRGEAPLELPPIVPRESRSSAAPEVVAVSVYGAEGSMGGGRVAPERDTIIGRMELSREWVRRNLPTISSPANLAVITAYGDSMEPTFRDGDILLVDRGVLDIKMDAVYVLGRNEELFVKRVQRRFKNGDIVIKSDNALFDPETVPAEEADSVRVLGRVVWAWNGKKL